MTEHDIEDVSTMLEGDQVRNLNNALITTFNSDGEIYHQADYGHYDTNGNEKHLDFKTKKNSSEIINSEKDNLEEIKETL